MAQACAQPVAQAPPVFFAQAPCLRMSAWLASSAAAGCSFQPSSPHEGGVPFWKRQGGQITKVLRDVLKTTKVLKITKVLRGVLKILLQLPNQRATDGGAGLGLQLCPLPPFPPPPCCIQEGWMGIGWGVLCMSLTRTKTRWEMLRMRTTG